MSSDSEDEFADIDEITTIDNNTGSPSHTCGTSLLTALNVTVDKTSKALTNVKSALKDIGTSLCGIAPGLGSPMREQHNDSVKRARKSVHTETVTTTVDDQQAKMVSFKFGFPVVLCIAAVLCSDSFGSFVVLAPESNDLATHASGAKFLCKVPGEVGQHVLGLMQAHGISNAGPGANAHAGDNTLENMLKVQGGGASASSSGGAVAKPDFKIGISAGNLETMLVTQSKTFAAKTFFTKIIPALAETLASTSVLDSLLVAVVDTPVSVWDSVSGVFKQFGEGAPVVPVVGDGASGSTPSGSGGAGFREIDLTQQPSTPNGKHTGTNGGGTLKKRKKEYEAKHEHFQRAGKTNQRPGDGSTELHKFSSSSSNGDSYTCPATVEEPTITTASDLHQPTVPSAYGDFKQSQPGDMDSWAADIVKIQLSSQSMKVPPVSSLDFDTIFTHMVDHCANAAYAHAEAYGWDTSNESVLCETVKKFSHQATCWKPQNVHYNFPIITAITQHTLQHILDRQTVFDNQEPLKYLQAKITDRIRPVASLMLHLVSFRELPLWMLVSSNLDVMIKAAFILTSQWNIDSWNKARKTVALMVAEYKGAAYASTAGLAAALTGGGQGLASLGMWLQAELHKKMGNNRHYLPPLHVDAVSNMHLLAGPHKVSWLASRSCFALRWCALAALRALTLTVTLTLTLLLTLTLRKMRSCAGSYRVRHLQTSLTLTVHCSRTTSGSKCLPGRR